MPLPIRTLPSSIFTFPDGITLPIRGLSRAEALQLRGLGEDVARIEVFCIAAATGTQEDEAAMWLSTTPQREIEDLVNAIARLSGLDSEAGKDDAEGLLSAQSTESISS